MLKIPERFLNEKNKKFRKIVLEIREIYQCSFKFALEKILFFYRFNKYCIENIKNPIFYSENKILFVKYSDKIKELFDLDYFEYLYKSKF